MRIPLRSVVAAAVLLLPACASPYAAQGAEPFDVIIAGGTIYDGGGGAPFAGDVGIRGGRIAAVGELGGARARRRVDASGLAVAPGFVNVLSWACDTLPIDGRAMSDVLQGVTLEVFGEGWSMGPLDAEMRALVEDDFPVPGIAVDWTTLGEFLESLERRGVSVNVASFVGATTVRVHELGYEDRPPTPEELERMCALVRRAMQEGALGVGSSLIYAPAFYARTDELVALCRVAAEYGGRYISHMRSEGNRLLEAVDELIAIAREAGIGAEIYHLKAAGRDNWDKLDAVVARVEEARAAGLDVGADMYTYTAGATGLDASMPPWVQEGGYDRWVERLRDPETRARIKREMLTPGDDWENLFLAAGSADNVLLVGFKNPELQPLTGMTLAAVAEQRGVEPADAVMDLVIEDGSRVETVYFLMSEDNVRRQISLPWVSFGSDAGAPAAEGVFLERNPHPRAYGNFARLLGRYVRDGEIIPLEEAIRRLTSLPAERFQLRDRGRLVPGVWADVVVFDPRTVADRATFAEPHQYATGIVHLFVNGEQVVAHGEHTGATPGRVVRGPGWTGWQD